MSENLTSTRTYNGGGGGVIVVSAGGVEYAVDCYVDAADYDMQAPTLGGVAANWDIWPDEVHEALRHEAIGMIDDAKNDHV